MYINIITNTALNPTVKYPSSSAAGNFSFATGFSRYTWSGTTNGTGSLPLASTIYSGVEFSVKNKSDTFNLLISGNIDNSSNFLLTPLSNHIFWSDGQTWNSV